MADRDIASKLAFETDAIRNESRTLKEQAARVAETMDRAHPIMSAAWKRIRELESALRPFAELAESYSGTFNDRLQLKLEESNNGDSTYAFTLGELRAALNVLKPETV